jgi:membrane protein implicated in regulation of membrane protease activity
MRARTVAAELGVIAALAGVLLAVRLPQWWPFALELVVFGLLVLASTLFERRYRRTSTSRRPGFQPTGETFVDPTTGATIDVDEDPATGERSYRPR